MKKIKFLIVITVLLFFTAAFFNACRPIRNFSGSPVPYMGKSDFARKIPVYDTTKKSVFIIADSRMTELFDMLAPFYLFNETGKANVFIVAKNTTPVLIKKDLYVVPQLTFKEADSMHLQADVIVMPALSIRDEHQDTAVISWIRNHFTGSTKMLAVCDGASTAAATGLYDGKSLTCHASDFEHVKSHFNKPSWVQNIAVTKAGNLFSTAGVSNAVEGSLTVINELFGNEIMKKAAAGIHYPHAEIKTGHQSVAVGFGSITRIARKVMFQKNRKLDLLIDNGVSEFLLASIVDTYGRSFPVSMKVVTFGTSFMEDTTIQTKYGLTLLLTGDRKYEKPDELHVLMPGSFPQNAEAFFRDIQLVRYEQGSAQYPIDVCLDRISKLYGHKFENVVKLMLDYN